MFRNRHQRSRTRYALQCSPVRHFFLPAAELAKSFDGPTCSQNFGRLPLCLRAVRQPIYKFGVVYGSTSPTMWKWL